MLTPVFKRHVQLARQEAAKAFNADVGEELEVTATVMEDINAAKVRVWPAWKNCLTARIQAHQPVSARARPARCGDSRRPCGP